MRGPELATSVIPSGLRIGAPTGLTRDELDLDHGSVSIRHTIQWLKGRGSVDRTHLEYTQPCRARVALPGRRLAQSVAARLPCNAVSDPVPAIPRGQAAGPGHGMRVMGLAGKDTEPCTT